MRTRRTREEKALALAVLDTNAGNVKLTARQLRIPASNLRAWRDGRGVGDRHAFLMAHKAAREALAERLEAIAWELAESLPAKMAAASLRDLAIGLGIIVDRMVLLRSSRPDNPKSIASCTN